MGNKYGEGDLVKYEGLPGLVVAIERDHASVALAHPPLERIEVQTAVLEPVKIRGRQANFIHAFTGWACGVGINLEPGRGISRPQRAERNDHE